MSDKHTAAPSCNFKIDRHCPRCRAHHYHWYMAAVKKCICANCSHMWTVRINRFKDLGETRA